MNVMLPKPPEGGRTSSTQEAVERYFATDAWRFEAPSTNADPAEHISFTNPSSENVSRFDNRTTPSLREVMFDHDVAMERERAAWEYGDRLGSAALNDLLLVAKRDVEPRLRWNALWLIQKVADSRAADALGQFLGDDHPEVQDWARLLIREITGQRDANEPRRTARFDNRNPFDQTLPLSIAGHARTLVPGFGWVQAILSPMWFESIMGRVMACTCASTFDSDLIIEKRIKEFHPDGTDHYEIYRFRGFTFSPAPKITHHIYEGISTHTFFPCGKVEAPEESNPIGNVTVAAARVARAVRVMQPLQIEEETERTVMLAGKTVESVRGRYMGSAYVSIQRLLEQNMSIGAGEVQLTDLHHPVVGPMTNTFLWGTFKGKLSDLNGDGYLDINTESTHATLKGELDYQLVGSANSDPFDVFAKT